MKIYARYIHFSVVTGRSRENMDNILIYLVELDRTNQSRSLAEGMALLVQYARKIAVSLLDQLLKGTQRSRCIYARRARFVRRLTEEQEITDFQRLFQNKYSIRPPVKRLIRRLREYCQSNGTDAHRRRNRCSKIRKNVKKSNNTPIQKQFCCTYTCFRVPNAGSISDSMELLAQRIRTISLQATNDYGSLE